MGITSGTHNYGVGWDELIVTEMDEDHSWTTIYGSNALHAYGSITKTAVAPGAELVAYGGFSGSKPITNAYNGSIGTSNSDVANNSAGGAYLTWDTSAYNLTGNLRIFCWSDGGEYDIYVNGNSGNTTKVGAVDFSDAGKNISGAEANKMYMVPPKLNNAQQTAVTNANPVAGAIIYNTQANKLRVFNGTSFVDLN